MKYMKIAFTVSIVFLCVVLYWRCFVALSSSTIKRSDTLTKAFAAILLSWVVLVLPYEMFLDFSHEEFRTRIRWGITSMMMTKVCFYLSGSLF